MVSDKMEDELGKGDKADSSNQAATGPSLAKDAKAGKPAKQPAKPKLGKHGAPGEEALIRDFKERNSFDPELFRTYDVKRGLRNADGTGVLAGITRISNVHGYVMNEGEREPAEGRLTYRGYEIQELVDEVVSRDIFGYERVACLLLMGSWPTDKQAAAFQAFLDENRELPDGFTTDMIMTNTTTSIMNLLSRCVSILYSSDPNAEDTGATHEVETAIMLNSRLPRVAVLGYHALQNKFHGGSMFIHPFVPGQSTAETILSMLRPDRQFTHEEAVMLDIMLMIHAEHGGGNNSTFVCRSLTSAGSDAYSAYAAAIGSLKGTRHGGANHKVIEMHRDIEEHVKDWSDEGAVADYLRKIVSKDAFDGTGLIYGMGHAVYTLSDPRAVLVKKYASKLVEGTELEPEYRLLDTIERLSPQIIAHGKGTAKSICANVDMYSGFVYRMLGIPEELFTPMFACSRMAGWSAHRFEELVSGGRIMRPAYKSIEVERDI